MSALEKPKLIPIEGRGENLSTGHISLYRSIRKHWIWSDPVKFQWWVDILLEANHKPQKVLIGDQLIECKRGQSAKSMCTWAKRWRVDRGQVRRFFKLLESDQMATIKTTSKTTMITICNYESYQDHRPSKGTTKRPSNEHQVNTNNNDNNDNKDSTRQWLFSHNGFFDRQLVKNVDEPELDKYQKLVEFLHSKDEEGKYLFSNVLSLEKQISYKDYLALKKTESTYNLRSLKSVLEAMENKPDLKKKYKNVFLTANNWLKNDFGND